MHRFPLPGRFGGQVMLLAGLIVASRFSIANAAPQWWWQSPFPQGNRLAAVWCNGPNDIYMAGDYGTILHYDGTRWFTMDSGTTINLQCMWGSGPGDVYAAGDAGTILHYDGTAWHRVSSGTGSTLWGIWGSGADNIYMVGNSGTILHWNGTAWTSMVSGTANHLRAIWGSGPGDFYAVGIAGTILRCDGTTWSAMSSGTTKGLLGVWGTGPGSLYAVGGSGTILHYTSGSAWSAMSSGTTGALSAVGGTGPNDIYAVGAFDSSKVAGPVLHYDGNQWSSIINTTSWLYAVMGTSAGDVYAVGDSGEIQHYNGATWSSLTAKYGTDNLAVWAGGPRDVFVVGGDSPIPPGNRYYPGILHYDGGSWSRMPIGETPYNGDMAPYLRAIWGSGPADVFAVGDSYYSLADGKDHITILHYDGITWSFMPVSTAFYISAPSWLCGVWGSGPNDVYAVGQTYISPAPDFKTYATILHYDGTEWSCMPTTASIGLNAIWGSGSNDVYAVGYPSLILHYDGTAWSTVSSDSNGGFLEAIWGSGPNDIYAVGDLNNRSLIRHYDGTAWSTIPVEGSSLTAVWGSGPKDVYVVGNTMQHFDGATWSSMPAVGGVFGGNGISGNGPNDVYVVCRPSTILHYPGRYLGDINCDGYVNVGDLQALVASWGKARQDAGYSPYADVNSDGFINVGDLQLLVRNWGR